MLLLRFHGNPRNLVIGCDTRASMRLSLSASHDASFFLAEVVTRVHACLYYSAGTVLLRFPCSFLPCVFIYNILNNMLSVSLRNEFVIVGNESQRLTRQAGNIVLENWNRNAQKSVFYEGLKMYNSLLVGIKQCDGLRTFKRELTECILNTIQYV